MKHYTTVTLFLFLSSFASASSVLWEEFQIESRGREQFRDTLLWKEMGKEGISGSNQYIDFQKKEILFGTNSNLKKYPEIYLGVSFGYLRDTEKETKRKTEKIRNYGLNTEVGYLKNQTLFLAGIGYDELRHTPRLEKRFREKEGHFFTEAGKLISFSNKDYFYPFIGFALNKIEGEKIISRGDIGFAYTRVWNSKWSTKIQSQYLYYSQRKLEENKDKKGIRLGANLSYQWYEDLSVNLEYRADFYAKKRNHSLLLGFSHNF